jgi:hypothetical protein
MSVNVFDLAGFTPNPFEQEPLNIFGSIVTNLSEEPENDWNNPVFHAEPEIPKPWVEYYRQSAIYRELLTIKDLVFKDHYKEDDKTEWCYCEDNKSSAKCSQW